MAVITITFPHDVNVSVQVGDDVYYTGQVGLGGHSFDNGTIGGGSGLVYMGTCTNVTQTTISCNISNSTPRPTSSSFICFSKDTRINTSGLTGYYAEVEMRNSEHGKQGEMFAVSSEVVQSSK